MESTYLVLLDYCVGEVIKVKLTDDKRKRLDESDDAEDFLYSIEKKYHSKVSQVSWMLCEEYCERIYGYE